MSNGPQPGYLEFVSVADAGGMRFILSKFINIYYRNIKMLFARWFMVFSVRPSGTGFSWVEIAIFYEYGEKIGVRNCGRPIWKRIKYGILLSDLIYHFTASYFIICEWRHSRKWRHFIVALSLSGESPPRENGRLFLDRRRKGTINRRGKRGGEDEGGGGWQKQEKTKWERSGTNPPLIHNGRTRAAFSLAGKKALLWQQIGRVKG